MEWKEKKKLKLDFSFGCCLACRGSAPLNRMDAAVMFWRIGWSKSVPTPSTFIYYKPDFRPFPMDVLLAVFDLCIQVIFALSRLPYLKIVPIKQFVCCLIFSTDTRSCKQQKYVNVMISAFRACLLVVSAFPNFSFGWTGFPPPKSDPIHEA